MIALPSDVARAGQSVRGAFRQVMAMMVGAFEADIEADGQPARDTALALVALIVGGMVLARAVDDPQLGEDLRRAARNHAYSIAGWQDGPASTESAPAAFA